MPVPIPLSCPRGSGSVRLAVPCRPDDRGGEFRRGGGCRDARLHLRRCRTHRRSRLGMAEAKSRKVVSVRPSAVAQ
jgi:hypothetical protein